MPINRFFAFLIIFWSLFLIGLPGKAHALDWFPYHPSPTPNEIFDTYSPDGSVVYLVGMGGAILHFDGTTFTQMDTPTVLPLYAIDGTGPTDIWAVGGDTATEATTDRAVVLHFDGNSWTQVAAPGSGSYPLSDVYAVSPTLAWAVMKDQNSVAKWNGVSWATQSTLPAFSQGFNKVCGAGASAIWFAGDYNQLAFYNGSTFTDITRDPSLGYLDFTSCWAADANTLFTGGNTGGLAQWDTTGAYQLISHDQGTKTISGITGASAADVYFLGYAGFFVHYDGATATQIITSDTIRRNAMSRLTSGDWIVGADKAIESFDGSAMTTISTPSPLTFSSINTAFVDTGLWLIPQYITATTGIEILGTDNDPIYSKDGASWEVTGANLVGTDDLRVGVYSYTDNKGHAYQYKNNTWTEWMPSGYSRGLVDILRTAGGDLFAIMGNTGYSSAGSACLVENESMQCTPGNVFKALASCGSKVYAVGQGGAVWVYDSGTWSGETSGVNVDLNAVACSDSHVYAVGDDRTAIWKSTGSWQPLSNISTKAAFDFTDVVHVAGNTFAASLKGTFGSQWMSFLYSFDSGAATLDQGWLGPSLRIDALTSNRGTTYALGWNNVLMYAGRTPDFGLSNGATTPTLFMLLN